MQNSTVVKLFLFTLCLSLGQVSWLKAAVLEVKIIDQDGKPVASAVVTATSTSASTPQVVQNQTAIIDQINKEYVPRVVIVTNGTSVNFPNKDNIKHHVYSFSKAKQFELPLYQGTPAKPVVFDTSGVVVLGCNIHDWMRGYIYITDTPFAALSNADGTAIIKNLPLETYQLLFWHPQLKTAIDTQQYQLTSDSINSLKIEMTLKPLRKIRRKSGSRKRRYN